MSEKYEVYFFEQLSKLVYMSPTFIRRIYSYNCLSTNWPDTVVAVVESHPGQGGVVVVDVVQLDPLVTDGRSQLSS